MMLHELSSPRSPEETRSRILAAARTLFAKKGRRGTTTREVAELAGVNEATLFRHFGNKDAMIAAVVTHFCKAVELKELLASLDGDLYGDLSRIALSMASRMEAVRDLILMSLVEEEQGGPEWEAPWRAPAAMKQLLADYMATRVAAGELKGDPAWLARFFVGMVFAQVVGRRPVPTEPSISLEDGMRWSIDVFLNGVRSK